MANRLGATFFRCAMGPVSYAGQCIMAGRVKEGIAELARDGLMGAWQRGVSEVASGAGAAVSDVEGLLPRDEVLAAADLLQESQQRAAEAWQMYAGHLGGLLAGIADLTVDGRVPEASLCLERLADKVARDKPLAEPLRLLAVDTQRWQDMIFDCKRRLEDGHGLAASFRRRRAMRLGAVGVAAALIAASVGAVGWAAVDARASIATWGGRGPATSGHPRARWRARRARTRAHRGSATATAEGAAAGARRPEASRREGRGGQGEGRARGGGNELAAGVARGGDADGGGRRRGALMGEWRDARWCWADLGPGVALPAPGPPATPEQASRRVMAARRCGRTRGASRAVGACWCAPRTRCRGERMRLAPRRGARAPRYRGDQERSRAPHAVQAQAGAGSRYTPLELPTLFAEGARRCRESCFT